MKDTSTEVHWYHELFEADSNFASTMISNSVKSQKTNLKTCYSCFNNENEINQNLQTWINIWNNLLFLYMNACNH